jgi:hypothetical protein
MKYTLSGLLYNPYRSTAEVQNQLKKYIKEHLLSAFFSKKHYLNKIGRSSKE